MKYLMKYESKSTPTPLYEVDDYILLNNDPNFHWSGIDLRCQIFNVSIMPSKNIYYSYMSYITSIEHNNLWDETKLFSEFSLIYNHEKTIERKLTPVEIFKYKKDIQLYKEKHNLILAANKYNL